MSRIPPPPPLTLARHTARLVELKRLHPGRSSFSALELDRELAKWSRSRRTYNRAAAAIILLGISIVLIVSLL